jgi:hypothetical protein
MSKPGQNVFLIKYKPTAVASTRGSVGLGCLLLVFGGWCRLVRIDRWLLAGGSLGLSVPFPELMLEVGHVGLVGELIQVESAAATTVSATPLARELKGPFT